MKNYFTGENCRKELGEKIIQNAFSKGIYSKEKEGDLRNTFTEFLQDLLEDNNYIVKLDEGELIEFFKDKTVVYSKEIKQNEIKTLKKISNLNITGVLVTFLNSGDICADEVYNIMKEINSNICAKTDTNIAFNVKIDKKYKEPMLRTVLVA